MSGHGYRYVGNGERWRGVPPRDLTQEEFEALGPLAKRTVIESGAYEPVKAPTAPAKPAEPVAPVQKGDD